MRLHAAARVAAVLALLLMQACTGPRASSDGPDAAPRPVACVAADHPCSPANTCCPGTSCVPQGGRLGWLCRHPYVD